MSKIISLFSAALEIQEIFNVILSLFTAVLKNFLKMKTSSIYKNS